jgi:hypothetical protein
MSATYTIDQKTGRTFFYVFRSSSSTGKFHDGQITLDAKAAVAEADSIVREAYAKSSYTLAPRRGIEEVEEREWDAIVSKPHVRKALRRMAAEARRQYYAGETKEGGFAIE